MIINQKNVSLNERHRSLLKKISKIVVVLSMVFLISLSIAFTKLQRMRDYIYHKGYNSINPESISSVLKRTPWCYIKSHFNDADVDEISIDINFANFSKIQSKVNESLIKGNITQEQGDFVPGTLTHSGKSIKVKLRIKGDNIDHIQGDKWSFRIEVSKDDIFFGMRRFSIQNPIVRGFQGQYIMDCVRNAYGLITLRRKIVKVTINGNDIGLMEIEEHFSKELIEDNGRKESVIVRFDESDSWKYGGLFDYKNSRIDAFGDSAISKSIQLKTHRINAIGLLRGFVEDKLQASEVFDVDEIGMFLAISELFGAQHGVRWGNLRFYYNPYTSRLQPIGYDDNFNERIEYNKLIDSPFYKLVLSDPVVYKAYIESLVRITGDISNEDFLSDLLANENIYLEPLINEFFLLENYDFTDVHQRSKYIQQNLLSTNINSIDYSEIKPAQVFLVGNKQSGSYDLQIGNILPVKTQILDIIHEDPIINEKLVKYFNKHLPFPMDALHGEDNMIYRIMHNVPFDLLNGASCIISPLDKSFTSHVLVQNYFPAVERVENSQQYVKELVESNILNYDKSNNTIAFSKGEWNIDHVIFVTGYDKFIIPSGVQLNFTNGSGIVSKVPINIDGSIETVNFIGDGTAGWLYLMETGKTNIVKNMRMENVGPVSYDSVTLTGAFTVYKSDINIEHLSMHAIKSEDALNIIGSNYFMNDCFFQDTNSDAIDIDYSNGKITKCEFNNIGILGGGDAADFSGSLSSISESVFKVISDKAISAGERSKIEVSGVAVYSASVGLASKDGSSVNIRNSVFSNITYSPIIAYMKKKEFTGGTINSYETKVDEFRSIFCDEHSTIIFDGRIIKKEKILVKELYNSIMKSNRK